MRKQREEWFQLLINYLNSGDNTAVPHRILCISATDAILQTRKLLLERHGYEVIPALNFRDVEQACREPKFHLVLVGHDLEAKIKKALGLKIRENCPGIPILEMCRYSPEIEGSTFTLTDSPEEMLQAISEILEHGSSFKSRGI